MNQHEKNRVFAQSFFLLLLALPAALLLTIPFVGQREESVLENRALQMLPAFTAASFLDGTFQDELEQGLIDQLPLMETVKGSVVDGKNSILQVQQSLLYAIAPDLKSTYSLIMDGYYHFSGDEHRIVEKPKDYLSDLTHLQELADTFKGLSHGNTYVYFIENSRTVDFEQSADEDIYYNQILDMIKPDGAACFEVEDYEAYSDLFYQTDHHWNYKGSYQGYQEIYRLLHGTEEGVIPPAETIETGAVFQGSYARQTHVLCADELFTFQTFDLPKYTTEINGRRRSYGNLKMYLSGKYSPEPLANHYANCFGGDFGEIVYDFGTTGKGNLLLVASSYSNPINALIAAGFDRTYVMDLRYYEPWGNHTFDLNAYCRENGIETVLLLGDVEMFYHDTREGAD